MKSETLKLFEEHISKTYPLTLEGKEIYTKEDLQEDLFYYSDLMLAFDRGFRAAIKAAKESYTVIDDGVCVVKLEDLDKLLEE